MFNKKIISLIRKNKPIINGWLSIPNSFTAQSMSNMGWDTLTIDMQHGQNEYLSSIPMLQGISNGSSMPFVRVPSLDSGIIVKMLDAGAVGIIAPMINNKNDCEKFVSICHYPPIGERSFGPARSIETYGQDYYKYANSQIITLAMIETEEAMKNLDSILSVKNLTGVYIGPSDMSISYGLNPKFDVLEEPVYSNIKLVAKKAKEYGKVAGIHNGSIEYAKKMINFGYRFVTVSSDYRGMVNYNQNIVRKLKNTKNKKDKNLY